MLVREGGEGNESSRSGDSGNDEAVEVVEYRPGEELAEGPWIAGVAGAEGAEVSGPVAEVDDCRRVAKLEQQEVEDQAAGAAVAIEERMDALELAVRGG